jgi:photosystem II stability/assembly factor-like uncharacterized protein
MLRLAGGVWTTEPTGLTQSLQGAHLFADDHVVTVGTGGSIYKFNGQTHLVMPTATKKTLRDVHGTDPDDLWAVGDDAMVLHFNGAAWSTEEVPTESDLRAVLVESDGTVLIAGNQTVLRRAPEGEWVKESSPAGNWYAIDETSSEDVWIVGRTGRVRHYNGTSWTLKSTPTEQGLRTVVARAPNDVWIGGESGTLMHWDGVDFSIIPPVTDQSLNDIQARGANELVAVGNYGTVLTYDGIAWVPAPITDYNQDLHAVALPPNTGNAYTFGDHQLILGPIVAPPRVSVPEAGGTLTENAVHWTADERVAPHYQHVEIYVPGLMGPVLIWELIADGDVGSAPLPDFAALQGTPGLQLGKHFLAVTRIYQEGFDIDNFDYTDLGSLDRQSWALEYFPFFTPTDTP